MMMVCPILTLFPVFLTRDDRVDYHHPGRLVSLPLQLRTGILSLFLQVPYPGTIAASDCVPKFYLD